MVSMTVPREFVALGVGRAVASRVGSTVELSSWRIVFAGTVVAS
jgi:hypothetical protein